MALTSPTAGGSESISALLSEFDHWDGRQARHVGRFERAERMDSWDMGTPRMRVLYQQAPMAPSGFDPMSGFSNFQEFKPSEVADTLKEFLGKTDASECAISPSFLSNTTNANCYGPNVNYFWHPAGTAMGMDNGMSQPNDDEGQFPGGDLGIWVAEESGEACTAAQVNRKVKGISSQVNSVVFTMIGMACAANAGSVSTPVKGEVIDITELAQTSFSTNSNPMTVQSALLGRLAQDIGGRPVYISMFKIALGSGAGKSGTLRIRVRHEPAAVGNTTDYRGKISYTLSSNGAFPGNNCPNSGGNGDTTESTSIEYQKVSGETLRIKLKFAIYCGLDTFPYQNVNNFSVDLSSKYESMDNPTGWGDNANYVAFELNTTDNTGNFQLAWQAGAMDSNTRVLNVKAGADDACGYFGYGPVIDQDTVGAITGMHCLWVHNSLPSGPGSGTFSSLAQRQCMTRGTTGKFVSDSTRLNIEYSPVESCSHNDSFDFNYSDTGMAKSVVANQAVTHNLINLSDVDVTAPTLPPDVDQP